MRFILLLFLIAFSSAHAQESADSNEIFIDVGKAQIKKSLLALPPFLYLGTQKTNAAHIEAGNNLFEILVNDLTVTNLFTFIKPEAYLEDPNKTGLKPAPYAANGFNFNNWKTIGAEFLIRGAYNILDGDLVVEVYTYHVPTGRMILGRNYKGPSTAHRRLAHTFANDLVKALTQKRGMFLTKLVASKQEKDSPIKEIYTLDWDGANQMRITSAQTISISPTWSTNGEKLAYTSFAFHKKQKMRNADLFTYELNTRKRFMISYRKGINSGAAFLPGDEHILLTISQDGTPDIFKMTVDGLGLTRLTSGPNRAMNVEPAVSPDGRQVAFSSDRSGRPMVYVMNIDGSNVRRLTFAGKYNASPSWSPDGKTLAYAGQDGDHFDIFTMSVDGGDLKRLTDARKKNGRAANNESPSWSPDGRHIAFTSDRTGNYQLYIVSPDGTNERRVTEDAANWDKPKWSPFLD